jgi:pilus assembly protein Flp/PilA
MLKFTPVPRSSLAGLLLRSDRGASAVEYGLLIILIAFVIIGAVTLLGTTLSSMFNAVAGAV